MVWLCRLLDPIWLPASENRLGREVCPELFKTPTTQQLKPASCAFGALDEGGLQLRLWPGPRLNDTAEAALLELGAITWKFLNESSMVRTLRFTTRRQTWAGRTSKCLQ